MASMSIFLVLAAVAVALIALATDLRTRRIPNWLTAGGALVGLAANILLQSAWAGPSSPLSGGVFAVLGAVLGFGLLFPFYLIRVKGLGHAIGAGDVKLIGALGAIVGPQIVISVVVFSALAGAIQSIIILVNQRRLMLLLRQTLLLHAAPALSSGKAPYAVAIAAGVFLSMILPPFVRL
jgi:prepilin peptidase CpaA